MPATIRDETWLRRYHPASEAAHQMLCLPHAGGSASFYYPVSRALAPSVEVLSVQYPGRQDRRHEPLIGSVPELTDQIVAAVRATVDRPLAVFGHSMGATLGFEVVRLLEGAGMQVSVLFVSGRRAPSTPREEPDYRQYTDADIIRELRSLNGTEGNLLHDDETLQMILPSVRNDYLVIRDYRFVPGPPLRCPVVALNGEEDPKVTAAEAEAWREHTSGPFDLQMFPGGHFYLISQAASVIGTVARHLGVSALSS
jgi:surfactin synthase thioesterase subunit